MGPIGIAFGPGIGPIGIAFGPGIGPIGIAFAVQAVTRTIATKTTFKIFKVLVLISFSPGGRIPPQNYAKQEYPIWVIVATTKVGLLRFSP
jgi:hypothetical protein